MQVWTDPTALAADLDAQPGLASYLADGLGRRAQSINEIEPLLNELHDEAKQFLERPLNADYLCLMLDAKTLYIRDEKGILEAVVKTWILADRLQRSCRFRPNGRLAAHLREWLRYFQKQYEPELISPCHTQTS